MVRQRAVSPVAGAFGVEGEAATGAQLGDGSGDGRGDGVCRDAVARAVFAAHDRDAVKQQAQRPAQQLHGDERGGIAEGFLVHEAVDGAVAVAEQVERRAVAAGRAEDVHTAVVEGAQQAAEQADAAR